MDTSIVLFRDRLGICHSFLDFCPHRGVPLSMGKLINDQIICAYHGWRFASDGSCLEIPALKKPYSACLKPINLLEKDGLIFARLSGDDNQELPSLTLQGYRRFYWERNVQGDLIDMLENLLDATHTPYIHNTLIRSSKTPKMINAMLNRSGEGVKIIYRDEEGQEGLISKLFEKTRTHSEAIFVMPGNAEINYYDQNGLSLKIKICLTLNRGKQYKAHIFFYLRDNFFSTIKYYLGYLFFDLALKQDLRVLKAQFENKSKCNDTSYVVNPESDLIRLHLHDLIINRDFSKEVARSFKLYV
jgi:phenylpropionate dioxygenase-like ring-hydroxylating dioxygenase large terminal subunit